MIKPRVPWGETYSRLDLQVDLFAGMTTAVMLIPQAMAYALLAGLPVEVGLYASTIPIIVYAFLGTARSLAVGPVALDSLLAFSAVGAVSLANPDLGSSDKVMMAALLALMTGVCLIVMGVLNLGRFVYLLTPTIVSSFTSAAAIIIAINQVKLVLGIEVVRSPSIYVIVQDILQKLEQTHVQTLVIGVTTIAILVGLKQFLPKVPRAFVVVSLGMLVVVLGDLGSRGVALVGVVPQGLPTFQLPWMDWSIVYGLAPHALVIGFVAFMESFSVGSKLKKSHEELDASRELIALGSANVATGFFQGYSVAGGLSRSAVNDAAGAKTQVASLITASVVVLTLSLFSDALANIPNAVLGAIILTAVSGLISIQDVKDIVTSRKQEIPVYALTFFITLLVGVKEGLLIGVALNWLLTKLRTNDDILPSSPVSVQSE